MSNQPLGAVIVGTGFGVLTHLRALRGAGIEAKALVGRNPEKTRDRATKVGIEHGLTSLTEALALPGVDLVTIATPPHTHCKIALEAIAAGKHVLCEKPFARSAEEGKQMLDAAEAAGIVHMLGTEFRFSTGQALATRSVREGLIGEARLVNFTMNVPVLADPSGEVPAWWSMGQEGGGWLGAYASHVIDQLRATLGEFAGVSASLPLVSDRDWTAEDSYIIHFRMKSGTEGVLQSTAGAWGMPVVCSKFYGNKGTLSIEGDNVTVANAQGIKTLDVPDDLVNDAPSPPPAEFMSTTYDHLHAAGFDLAPYTKLCGIMRDRIQGKQASSDPAPGTFADGYEGQKVLDAIRLSAAERRWVDID
ncbi:MAG TPA: Gfo/Idh/MocA family oxidoreductase [Myxococcales bacterium]|jgi:predicted dehydrogenase|nr:Gfo/Idh/MocA family oxidoreductase [Myxococcales bacterium]HIM01152.1 Gfo/Idh/MocA family oxidoreductase [Myxococcales bacterium]